MCPSEINHIIEPKYQYAHDFAHGLARIGNGEIGGNIRYGLIDIDGKIVTPIKYEQISAYSEGMTAFACGKECGIKYGIRWGYFDQNGTIAIEPNKIDGGSFSGGMAQTGNWKNYNYIDKSGETLLSFKFDNTVKKSALLNDQGQEISPAIYTFRYDDDGLLKNGMIRVHRDEKYGYLDKNGAEVIPAKYERVYGFGSDGISKVKEDGKYIYLEKTGAEVKKTKPRFHNLGGFERARPFSEGLASVKKDGKKGFIDKSGKWVLETQFAYTGSFHEGLASFKQNDKWGYINRQGTMVIPPVYDDPSNFSEGLAAVLFGDLEDGLFGYINKKGEQVIPPTFYEANLFENGRARVWLQEGTDPIYINKKGKQVPKPDETSQQPPLRAFDNGQTGKDKRYGFKNSSGQIIIPAKYSRYSGSSKNSPNFSEGMLSVVQNRKYGFINEEGIEIIPPIYRRALSFSEGLAAVRRGTDSWGYIDKSGKEIISSGYDEYGRPANGFVQVKRDNQEGVIDNYGREIIPTVFDGVGEINNGSARVTFGQKSRYMRMDGVPIGFNLPLPEHDEVADVSNLKSRTATAPSPKAGLDYLEITGGDRLFADLLSRAENEWHEKASRKYGSSTTKRWREIIMKWRSESWEWLPKSMKEEIEKYSVDTLISMTDLDSNEYRSIYKFASAALSTQAYNSGQKALKELGRIENK